MAGAGATQPERVGVGSTAARAENAGPANSAAQPELVGADRSKNCGAAPLANVICITNRKLCPLNPPSGSAFPAPKEPDAPGYVLVPEDSSATEYVPAPKEPKRQEALLAMEMDALLRRLPQIIAKHPQAIILREKDLSEKDYEMLLRRCQPLCDAAGIPLIAHTFAGAARRLGVARLHLPLPLLLKNGGRPQGFDLVGTSVHSIDDAKKALACGADYLIAGHIFETGCKAGLPGRGLPFLKKICQISTVPVYAIGGITVDKLPKIQEAGAAGGCMMSGLFTGRYSSQVPCKL